MDLHYSQTWVQSVFRILSLNPLWIYTTLKHEKEKVTSNYSLNPLWIYTTLKQSS